MRKKTTSSGAAIAIVGMGCWYPGANDLRQLWENVLTRRRQFRRMPDERLPLAEYYDPDSHAPDKTYGTRAAVIDGFEFDWIGRHVPKSTYESTDIVHWFALEVAVKALEDAGYTRENVPTDRSGVILGNTLTGEQTRANTLRQRWPFVRKALRAAAESRGISQIIPELETTMEAYYKSVFSPTTEDSLSGGLSNTIAGRICNFLNFHGGGYTVDGACSSSLISVATAATALVNKDMDLALAGGVDISLDTFELIGFAKTGALTKTDMTVYDKRASGFIPGEGCGFVVLKRLEDAHADGNFVYAVLRGWGISSDGKGGLTAPGKEGQAMALRRAYTRAGYSPKEVTFFEGHGTGTPLGDKTEIEGIMLATGNDHDADIRVHGVTSFKSIVGHTKAAAGIGGFIKTVMAVNRCVVPPTASCKDPNPIFSTEAPFLYPVMQGEVRNPEVTIRAGVSAMGFGGINCHVTLESGDAPAEQLEPSIEERALLVSNQDTEVFVFDAPSISALIQRATAIRKLAFGMSLAELIDLAAKLASELKSHSVRAALIAGSPDEVLEQIDELIAMLRDNPPPDGETAVNTQNTIWVGNGVQQSRVGFLFPGQGSQHLNMARVLVERFQWARDLVGNVDSWLEDMGLEPISQYIFVPLDRALNKEQSDEWAKTLGQTQIAQPAICLATLLWMHYLARLGIEPAAVGGHSLGELSAFFAAGVFDERSLITLAAMRGQAMAAPADNAGTMASLSCPQDVAVDLLKRVDGYVVVANINSPKQTVISGERAAVEAVVELAKAADIQSVMLSVSNAFHSNFVATAADYLRDNAPIPDKLRTTEITLLSSVTGKPAKSGLALRDHFGNQILSQVDFIGLMKSMSQTCDFMIEVGPGKVLSGLVRDTINPGACLPVASKPGLDKDLNTVIARLFVQGGKINWATLYENRLVREFTAASERLFIENQCERPFKVSTVAAPIIMAGGGMLESMLASTANISTSTLTDYLSKRGRFIAEVIRADLQIPSIAISGPNGGSNGAHTKPAECVIEIQPVRVTSSVETRVIELVAERTGYPAQQIPLTARLLDDLNLDSIKAGELIAAIAKEYDAAGLIDPATLANSTLQEIAQMVRDVMPAQTTTTITTMEAVTVVTQGAQKVEVRLVQLIADRTGYPAESISLDAHLLDDLNLDSIKAGELIAAIAREYGVAGQIDPATLANASLREISDQVRSLAPERTEVVQQVVVQQTIQAPVAIKASALLLELVEQRTGFPRESLTTQMHLLDDLNLDSIKAGELIAEAARRVNVAGEIDPTTFANSSIAEIAAALEQLMPAPVAAPVPSNAPKAAPMPKPAAQPVEERAGWVRNFATQFVDEDIEGSGSTNWTTAHMLIVHEIEEARLARAINGVLLTHGADVTTVTYAEAREKKLIESPDFTHFVAILPSTPRKVVSEEARLHSMAERLLTVGLVPKKHPKHSETTVAYVQFGGGVFGVPGDSLEQTCTAAFAASLHLERPDLRVRVIDFSSEIETINIVNAVLNELAAPGAYLRAGYAADLIRRVPQQVAQEAAFYQSRNISWTPDDVILVTGGGKGITAECAIALAEATGVKMALIGSSPHPDADPAAKGSDEIAGTLGRFMASGLIAQYYQCNMASAQAVNAMVEQVRQELGPITGVIHGAGINKARRVEQTTVQTAVDEVSPKVLGAINLSRALHDAPPKLFIGFSSIIGVTGMQGNTWYGFSNEALNLILQSFNAEHPETQVISMAFSIWGDVGMGVKMGSTHSLAKMGILSIPAEEGVRRFLQLVAFDPGEPQVIVAGELGFLDTWTPVKREMPMAQRYLENIVSYLPDVELIVRPYLTLARDAYVKDHIYKGSPLFPTVFGLEAMAQAVAYVTGQQDFTAVRIEDIRLERPIVVNAELGVNIRIRATVVERETPSALQYVRVGISAEQTGYARDHFAATFVLGIDPVAPVEAVEISATPLDIEPKQDLYSWLLFQGPLFQRLQQVHSIDSKTVVFRSEVRPYTSDGSEDGTTGPFILGDPYFRDSLLQAPQLTVSQDICLPIYIESLELHNFTVDQSTTRDAVGVFDGPQGRQIHAHVFAIDDQGNVLERLNGYRLQVLEHLDNNPTPEQIAAPTEHDADLLREKLASEAHTLGLESPQLALAYLPDLHGLSREARHERELPLFAEALSRLLGTETPPEIEWLDGKRPVVKGADDQIGVSLSHDERVCLCVAGSGSQGCDITPVLHSSWDEWIALLSNGRQALLQKLVDGKDPLSYAGTRIWAAVEALRKATNNAEISLALVRQSGSSVVFRSGDQVVLTFPVTFIRGPERMIAVVLPMQEESKPEAAAEVPFNGATAAFDNTVYAVDVKYDGPQGQLVYGLRFPLTFRDTANLSRTLYFSHFFDWMGKLREVSCQPVLNNLADEFATGKWGMVTNRAYTMIYGEATANEVIQGRIWLERLYGPANSTMDLCYEWLKKLPDGSHEQIAISRMTATWVAILEHGVVEARPFPEYFEQYMTRLQPKVDAVEAPWIVPERVDLGRTLHRLPTGPANKALLREQRFETSLEEANLVGNIYFANYYIWQGRIMDHFFYQTAPTFFRGIGEQGEFRCVYSKVDHLREAMPFEQIAVKMSLGAIYEHGIQLLFDYFRVTPDGKYEKLAIGEHEAAWVVPAGDDRWVPAAIPTVFRDALLAKAGVTT